ncbi:BZ3500_MvSof-1268-A1-R1_Chr3-1g05698 [Microbotryum saponariae]|uniref:BZ3500_MvSof-1268-A1-R1_Chr3-1g05698 protein n=1 Tax=Microbotryum saponariae TaxID=289078 RepID=A0A2X0N2R2_9BASI|nr:BZ3500_MvSof-1268-A1-R1_Chr3-1g05698 [Microbotryum saponariae]SDA04888.1 BZ3501_MvSof-1269-A2-R1_Chr3-1g05368 [Microbotryum saponariae]
MQVGNTHLSGPLFPNPFGIVPYADVYFLIWGFLKTDLVPTNLPLRCKQPPYPLLCKVVSHPLLRARANFSRLALSRLAVSS